MNTKAMEMTISIFVYIVLGMLILLFLSLALTGKFGDFWNKIKGYSGSDIDGVEKMCKSQCDLDLKTAYCCGEKKLNKENVTCQDTRIKSDCSVDCVAVNCTTQ